MIDALFGSKTRVKLLHLFLNNPNRAFYVREITRKIDEQINSVRRELSNLLSIGIITSDNTNNRLYYEVNQKFEHYEALFTRLRERGFRTVVAGMSEPNWGSTRFHLAMGFEVVGTLHHVGWKDDRWWDVTLFQRDLAVRPELRPGWPSNG